jgi:putative zinc finger protein
MTDEFSTYDAAYLLGALTPADRSRYEEHLTECDSCRHAVNLLAGLPGLLAALTPEQARGAGKQTPDVPETLLPRLMHEVQRVRFRRRLTNAVVGLAAAAVFVFALVLVGFHGSSPTDRSHEAGTTPPTLAMTPVSDSVPITATAQVDDKEWGTQIVVRCVYHSHDAGGSYPGGTGPRYSMVVVDKSGGRERIASWEAKPGPPIVVDGSTSMPSSQIARIEVHDAGNDTILAVRL